MCCLFVVAQDALNHPYLHELHSRAREPLCETPFDWAFERDYPDEMPQTLLQRHMFNEMLAFRADQRPLYRLGAPGAAPFAAGMGTAADVPVAGAGAGVMPASGMDADASATTA